MENSKFYETLYNLNWMKSKQFPFKTELRLQENRERKNEIEREDQRKRQLMIEKRKLRETNIQTILQSRIEQRNMAKQMFQTYRKTNFSPMKIDLHHSKENSSRDIYTNIIKNPLSTKRNLTIQTLDYPIIERGHCFKKRQLQRMQSQLKRKQQKNKIMESRYSCYQRQHNPIEDQLEKKYFGLSNQQFRSSQILQKLYRFILISMSSERPEEDRNLLEKFQSYLAVEADSF